MDDDLRIRLIGAAIGCIVALAAKYTLADGLPLWAAILGGIGFGSFILHAAVTEYRNH